MESLLHYIYEQRLDEKPNFVTIRQLITAVAGGAMKKLFVIPFMGVLFLLPKKIKWEDEYSKKPSTSATTKASSSNDLRKKAFQYGGNFQQFMTHKDEKKPISTERNSFKAVLKATIDGQSIIYSGEIDALGDNDEHYEFKAISGGYGNDDSFSRNSQEFYWQAYFGNVKTILIGARTDEKGKDPKTGHPLFWPEFSLYKVQKVNREDIPDKKYLEKKPKKPNLWKVETGVHNIHEFFKLVKEECTEKRVCYVATSEKTDEDVKWTFKRADEDKKEVESFRTTLRRILGTDEKKILKTEQKTKKAMSGQKQKVDA